VGQFVAFVRATKYVTEAEKEGTVDTWSNNTWGRAPGSWKDPGCPAGFASPHNLQGLAGLGFPGGV
jgi:hypothetical protein